EGAEREEGRHGCQDPEIPPDDRAGQPEAHLVHRLFLPEQEGAGPRAEQRGDDDAGEREPDRARLAAPGRSDGEDEGHRAKGSGESDPDVLARRAEAEIGDGEGNAEAGALAYPEDRGIGEGIPRYALDDGSGHAERAAEADADDRPGHAPLADDDLLVDRAVEVEQAIPGVLRRDLERTESEAEEGQDAHDDHTRRQTGKAQGDEAPRPPWRGRGIDLDG